MTSAQIASFSLWGVTAFAATGMLLSLDQPQTAAIQPIADIQAASFSTSEMTQLFTPPVKMNAKAAPPAGNLKIQGIVYSSDPQMSRAVITSQGQPKHYALGSKLPNGGTLTAIEKRRIAYQAQGQTTYVDLPAM